MSLTTHPATLSSASVDTAFLASAILWQGCIQPVTVLSVLDCGGCDGGNGSILWCSVVHSLRPRYFNHCVMGQFISLTGVLDCACCGLRRVLPQMSFCVINRSNDGNIEPVLF